MDVGSRIYLPGKGMSDVRIERLAIAAQEYDERLTVGKNEESGDWCVYMRMPRGTFSNFGGPDLYPVLGLGREYGDLPHPDDLQKRLYRMDTVRHGMKMLDDMNRHNEEIHRQQQYKVDEGTAAMAEGLEWGLRRMSNDIGKRRVQINMGEPVARRRPEAK